MTQTLVLSRRCPSLAGIPNDFDVRPPALTVVSQSLLSTHSLVVRTTIDRNEEYQSVYGSLGPHTGPGSLTRHAAHLGEPPQGRGCPNWQIGADPAEPRSETASGDFSRLLGQSRLERGHVILPATVTETGTGAGGILSVDSRAPATPL